MLFIREIKDRTQLIHWLDDLQISKQTWLLSDLRTKFEIQDFYMKKNGFFLEESVLRISDLWKKILQRSHPHYVVVSQQTVVLHLRYFLRQHGTSIGLPESSENTLLKWMIDLAPFHFHPEGEEKLSDWFNQNPLQEDSWKDWWLRSKAAFAYFKNKNQLLPQWIPSFLQAVPDLSEFWEKDLFVDLGGQLSYVEAELLKEISKKNDVTILIPRLNELNKYPDLMHPYEYLKGFSQQIQTQEFQNFKKARHYSSYTSSLASIRQTTVQVRKWIEEDIPLSQIAIVAPDIESIWPTLSFHLEQEGIPVNKPQMSAFQSTVEAQYFLSKLRTLNKNLSTRDLELALYSGKLKSELVFEKFEALYKNIYDSTDYLRFEKIKSLLDSPIDLSTSINQSQFIFEILNQIIAQPISEIPIWLEKLVREILSSFDENFLMPLSDWISFCETSLSRLETLIEEARPEGIIVTNLMSSHFLNMSHRIFLELSEESLKVKSDRGLLPQTARQLSKDLGFWLSHSEKGDAEFELEWAMQDYSKIDFYYFSAINLSGQIMTPSSVWLKKQNQDQNVSGHGDFQIPEKTVLDEFINFKLEIPRLFEEAGDSPFPPLKSRQVNSISPSAFEAFQKCPFIFYARQNLGLKTFPEIDLDLDRRSSGEALHFLFEKIMDQDLEFWNEESIAILVQAARDSHYAGVIDSLWPPLKKKMVKLCLRFVEFEKNWRIKNPQTRETQTEIEWSGNLSGMTVRGRIDRVDISKNNELIVLDYKLSGNQLKGAHQWIENGSLQMLFYIYALENGWAKGLEGQVAAAYYFVAKNFTREVGFEIDSEIPNFFQPTKKLKQKFSPDGKQKLLNDFIELTSQLAERLNSGEIQPHPKDESTCITCEWRRLCRAPHLA